MMVQDLLVGIVWSGVSLLFVIVGPYRGFREAARTFRHQSRSVQNGTWLSDRVQ